MSVNPIETKPKTSKILVSLSNSGAKANAIAGDIFCETWRKITDQELEVLPAPVKFADLEHDLVIIGSDHVNPMARELFFRDDVTKFKIKYGSDDFHLLSVTLDSGVNVLVVAGGSGRANIYAVYEFFAQRAGAAYFWDGDTLPHCDSIDISNLDVADSPRFKYRGLRYFAHRGLHRFQAEHWGLDEWKREIDWILKRKMNLFMLRTGQDDLFQRAFPDTVEYPPEDREDPNCEGMEASGYDMRTSPISLRQRGILRQQVLQYARDRGLMHPEDCGTMTHWYSRTPKQFLESGKVKLFNSQNTAGYNQDSGKIWDIFEESTWENYWKLTQTHIDEYGSPELFHTIGLAERKFGKNREENLKVKKYVYHKIQELVHSHYPNAPLMLANWDFIMYWRDEEVKELLDELDPDKTLILDYLSDFEGKWCARDFGYLGKFPWILGLFHAFEPESLIRGNYEMISERLRQAADDHFCQGMVLWPELSRADCIMLEYFTANSWRPEHLDIGEVIDHYCAGRHEAATAPQLAGAFRALRTIANESWTLSTHGSANSFIFYPHIRLKTHPFGKLAMNEENKERYQEMLAKNQGNKKHAAEIVGKLVALLRSLDGETISDFLRRDIVDIARTALDYALRELQLKLSLELVRDTPDKEAFAKRAAQRLTLTETLADLLAQNPEFSIYLSLEKTRKQWGELNPAFEKTLKHNQENGYCRSYTYEQAKYLFAPEFKLWAAAAHDLMDNPTQTAEIAKQLETDLLKPSDEFMKTPLAKMAPREDANMNALCAVLQTLYKSLKTKVNHA